MPAELLCIGLSHKTAPLAVREKFAVSPERQAELLSRLATQSGGEAMLISTCNRVELYAVGAQPRLRELARMELSGLGGAEALGHTFELSGEDALQHLFRVAASLDSMVVGEPQILGQVKDAFERAQAAGAAKGELTRICSAAFSAAKRVRTETEIGKASVSMASAAVQLATKIFGALGGRTVLLVGAGEMARDAAKHLRGSGAGRIVVTNRTADRATALAKEIDGEAADFSRLFELLTLADVVVCSTASPDPIFTRANVGSVLKARRHRPLFMVDLAVPRDIASGVHALENVYAYDVDDIQKVVSENTHARGAQAARADVLLGEELGRFLHGRAVRDGVPVLAQLRKHAEQIARAEAEKTVASLGASLTERQKKSVEAMAMAIVNKLLHTPTSRLRSVAADEGDNRLAGATAELFGLDRERDPDDEQDRAAAEAPPAPRAEAGSK